MIPCTVTAQEFKERIERVHNRISDAGGDPEKVTLVAVTKGFDSSAVELAGAAGLTILGENYAQELVAKAAPAQDAPAQDAPAMTGPSQNEPDWHFIGRLQTNKIRSLAPFVSLWQSVDRRKVGAEIAKRQPDGKVLVQVNVSGEQQKGGCEPAEVPELVSDLTDLGLTVLGLMTVGASGEPASARPGFAELSRLADRLDLPFRSMGMSSDLEVAVGEGSNMVRIGTDLFGPRSPLPALGN